MNLNKYIDHTLLKPNATKEDIITLCKEANEYNFYSVCVNPCFVELAKQELKNTFSVTGIVNLHFFEFCKDFTTDDEEHPFYELVFVNSGKLYISSDDYSGELTKNQMIIHRAGITHSLRCPADKAPTVIIIGFVLDSDIINTFSREPIELSPYAIRKLAEIVKEGRNVFKPPYNVPVYDMKKKKHQALGSEQMLRILLEYFLIKVLREHGKSDTQDDGEAPALINEIIQYVSDNCLEKITIDELAFLFKTNRATLCKDFKRTTGRTVIEYINEKKYELAKQRILTTDATFTQISADLNFESIHYFTRFFKKMSGMTPKDFRKVEK